MVQVDDSSMGSNGNNPFAHALKVPTDCVGVLIGKGGDAIAKLQKETGLKI